MRVLAAAVLLAAVLAMSLPGAAPAQPKPAKSLCRAPEPVLFTCHAGNKLASICGQQQGGAVYRLGCLGRVEIEVPGLHFAQHTFWGGGETQVYADTPTHRYIVYDRMVRTGIDDEGHNPSEMTEGLVVQSGGRMLSSQECAQPLGLSPPAFDQQQLKALVLEGDHIRH